MNEHYILDFVVKGSNAGEEEAVKEGKNLGTEVLIEKAFSE